MASTPSTNLASPKLSVRSKLRVTIFQVISEEEEAEEEEETHQ